MAGIAPPHLGEMWGFENWCFLPTLVLGRISLYFSWSYVAGASALGARQSDGGSVDGDQ